MTGQPMNDEPQFRQPENSARNIQDAHHADDLVLPQTNPQAVAPTHYLTNSVSAVLGTKQRDGAWIVPPSLTVNSTLGTVKLDMREAVFESLNVVIDLSCFMGDVKIWVPKGTVIVDETRTFGSDIKLKKLSPPQPGSPKLTLTGTLVFGEVIVYGSKHITLSDRIQGNF